MVTIAMAFMRRSTWFMLVIVLAWGAAVAGCGRDLDHGVVAKVDGQDITLEEFKTQAAFMGLGGDPRALTPELRRAVLETLVRQGLVSAEAQRLGLSVSQEDLSREEGVLRQGMSDEDFERALAAQGLNRQQWRQVLGRELLARKAMDLVLTPKAQVSADEVRDYFQAHREEFRRPAQVLAQHVVLPSRELAAELLKRVVAGEDMAKAAADLGVAQSPEGRPVWLGQGHMPEGLEKTIFALEPGKLAGPLASDYGFHVIRVLDKRPAAPPSLEAATEKIQRLLAAQKMEELAEHWMQDLRTKGEVSFDEDFLAHGRS